ncbi:MAG: 50S ribosomal protein L18 [Methanobacteriota archaeon]|nr:MAG: 50S ribosomal protein L18 [Euryarchaeota archaeon]
MAVKTGYKVPKRRKREGKTNYRKRLALLLSQRPRLVVRKSHNNVQLQITEYHPRGDRVLASAHSKELRKLGYKGHGGNAVSGYLVGLLGGKRALEAGVKEAVLDIGLSAPVKGSSVFAVLAGAVEAGLKVPHGEDVLPPMERFSGVEDVKKRIMGGEG